MKAKFCAVGLLCALDAARVCAGKDASLQPEDAISRSSDILQSAEGINVRVDALSLLPEEYRTELLSLSQSLEALDNGNAPYCSGRVSTLLQRCTKDRLAAEDRDEAAMLLTLCDRARDYAPPMECEGLSMGADRTDKVAVKRCTIALDQHQNFQRTFDVYRILVIPEKCKSLNGIFNVDPSRETYQNITLDLMRFLQAFAQKEAKTEEYFAQWGDRLNSFQDATADLSTTKRSLVEYNEQFVDDLSGMMRMLNATFEGMAVEGRRTSEEISLVLRDEISRVGEEHGVSLALAMASVETSFSAGLKAVFDIAQERQNNLDSAAVFTIKQLMDAVDDLSVARQDFEALSVFVRETTAKAYNQAFLLDKKQHEVSESLSGLGTEIRGLADTTHELNMSLADIREDTDNYNHNGRRADSDASWLDTIGIMRSVFRWLGLPPFWALSFLVLSLPRFVLEQVAKALLWLFAVFVSYTMRVLFGHRKRTNNFDAERNGKWSPSMEVSSRLTDERIHGPESNAFAQITYTAENKPSYQPNANPTIRSSIRKVDKILEDWAAVRSRVRISSSSRLPSRLYNAGPTSERLTQTRF